MILNPIKSDLIIKSLVMITSGLKTSLVLIAPCPESLAIIKLNSMDVLKDLNHSLVVKEPNKLQIYVSLTIDLTSDI